MGDKNKTEKKDKKNKKTGKALCKLAKGDFIKEHLEDYKSLVGDPKYLCRKCGRVAADKKNLCKTEKLQEG